MEQYEKKIKMIAEILHNTQNNGKRILRSAISHLPYLFTIPYQNLTLLRQYKRIYLMKGIPTFRFSDMIVPSGFRTVMNQLLKECFEIPRHLLIIDRNTFSSIVKDIDYFYRRQLITENERMDLKEELLASLTSVENVTATGMLGQRAEMSIYLSDVALETSYVHFEADAFENSYQYTYFGDILNFNKSIICQMHKNWIESLKRYSTLITQTGEMQRIDFFKEQREIVKTILN